jgi:hypothetical protein
MLRDVLIGTPHHRPLPGRTLHHSQSGLSRNTSRFAAEFLRNKQLALVADGSRQAFPSSFGEQTRDIADKMSAK